MRFEGFRGISSHPVGCSGIPRPSSVRPPPLTNQGGVLRNKRRCEELKAIRNIFGIGVSIVAPLFGESRARHHDVMVAQIKIHFCLCSESKAIRTGKALLLRLYYM